MNKEYLLDRLLDGSLRDDEIHELEKYILNDPKFADEVHSMLLVEKVLWNSAEIQYTSATPFREEVAEKVKARMRAESGAGALGHSRIGATGVGMFSRLRSGWLMGTAVGLLLVSSLMVTEVLSPVPETGAFVSNPDIGEKISAGAVVQSEQFPLDKDTRHNGSLQDPVQKPDSRHQGAEASGASATIYSGAGVEEHSIAESGRPTENNGDFLGSVNNNRKKNNNIELTLTRELAEYRAAIENDNQLQAAMSGKLLGMLYRTKGNHGESFEYLNDALKYARKTGFRHIEGQILGELGLLYKESGSKEQARKYLKECVEILSAFEEDGLSAWRKHLSEIE